MRVPVAREGWPFILTPAAVAAGFWLAGRRRLATPFAAAALASLAFFRDPERRSPPDPRAVLAPADGRVTEVVEDRDEWVGPAVRVSVFLSPLDVHVNRSPIAGRVAATTYTPGRFVAAYQAEAGRVNERCAIHLESEDGARVSVVQVAGVVARRIVCRVVQGDKLQAGERFGMIRFGSRTDCLMPRGTDVRVRTGERVRGGETILGILA
jgi:phosphatidylserine decarboxylase